MLFVLLNGLSFLINFNEIGHDNDNFRHTKNVLRFVILHFARKMRYK